jgi:hypothetical protein
MSSMQVMMRLPAERLPVLQALFAERPHGLSLHQFVSAMLLHLDKDDTEDGKTALIADLIELFKQVDVNGDGHMDWDEFTAFVIEAGMVSGRSTASQEQKYSEDAAYECGSHMPRHMRYFPALHLLAVCESEHSVLKFFDPHTLPGAAVPADGGAGGGSKPPPRRHASSSAAERGAGAGAHRMALVSVLQPPGATAIDIAAPANASAGGGPAAVAASAASASASSVAPAGGAKAGAAKTSGKGPPPIPATLIPPSASTQVLAIEYLEGLDLFAIAVNDLSISLWNAEKVISLGPSLSGAGGGGRRRGGGEGVRAPHL